MLSAQETDVKHEKKVGLSESLALQSYEFFDGGPERKTSVDRFVSGESSELVLEYPLLDDHEIEAHVSNLYVEVSDDNEVATAEYRLAEAYFLLAARRLNSAERPVSQQEIDHFQEMNEAIYGKPDAASTDKLLTRLWILIDGIKNPIAQSIQADLSTGFEVILEDGSTVEVLALPRPENDQSGSLPELSDEAVSWLQETLLIKFAEAKDIFEEYFNTQAGEVGVGPEEIATLFEEAIETMGLDVGVILKENATMLSWSSADGAVCVGSEREPIKTANSLLGVFVHEVGVLGIRSSRGNSTGIEALGSGLFTEADEGEDPSYLAFEEGLASTLQAAVQGKAEKWSAVSLAPDLCIALAHQGWTPRQTQELVTKIRTVVGIKKDTEQITPEVIQKAAKATANYNTVRVFRGTPTDRHYKTSEGVTLHYAKDLAYVAGKIKAIPLLNQLALLPAQERENELELLLSSKYDPTNKRQKTLVESVERHDKVMV